MTTRHARVADKELNEKHTKILAALLDEEDNSYCADCRKKDPRWASWNLGIFVCIRCSGIHRSLGTHISKVKSVDLDTWTPEQIENMTKWGNRRARMYWEAEIGNGKPSEANMDVWIRAKYEHKRWVSRQEQHELLKHSQLICKKEKERLAKEQLTKERNTDGQNVKKKSFESGIDDIPKPTKDTGKSAHEGSSLQPSKTSLSSLQSQFSQLALNNSQSSNMIPKAPPGSDMSWTNFLVSDKPKDNTNILSEPSKEKPLISFDALASLLKQ
ncbi:hypothetical protein A0J61_10044 [Choanephora cucurbitarum]|uniref:Arf-GAP domain-containing protein n=1 Tax=Choanephora cucurbitarum TaxID=101091 RepID=A0A1C7MYQ8_9FUNG|nr:hypothetical protein A0J61_10044 [Choanephora cucurbitarum]